MKAKLINRWGDYRLYVNETPYATTGDSPYAKLSLKNCQAIERGYDLDELADESVSLINESNTDFMFKDVYREYFKEGFQKALELIGDKKFSEEDMKRAFNKGAFYGSTGLGNTHYFDGIIESLQQTEWDVEIEMEFVGRGKHGIGSEVDHYMPKRDEDRCLILKRI